MRLYQTTGENGEVVSHWSGAQADSSKDRVVLKKAGCGRIETHEYDIPTDKVGLLKWLNDNKVVV
jgi:hypothetical protein